jgi:hypothetical protein
MKFIMRNIYYMSYIDFNLMPVLNRNLNAI